MRKVRKETGLFVAEGASLLVTARDNGFVPETLVYQAGTATSGIARGLVTHALNASAEVLEVSEAVLAKLASKDNPQTLLGVFRQRFVDAPMPKKIASSETWLALEEVRDPGNLGTIIRTADAVGCSGVILVGTTCDPYALGVDPRDDGLDLRGADRQDGTSGIFDARERLARRRHRNASRCAR